MTIGQQWAWKPADKLKSKKECIHTLAQTVGGDGNLLFNEGPMPDGRIEQRQVDRLLEMGEWVSANQEAVYGTRGGPFLPSPELVSTHKEQKIYLYLLKDPGKKLKLPFVKGFKVKNAYFLQNGQSVSVERKEEELILSLPAGLPDPIASIVVLELDGPAGEICPLASKTN